MKIKCFSSDKFLSDVKSEIKFQFKSQEIFAKKYYYTRKQMNRILNSGDDLTIGMINFFCEKLNLSYESYVF